MRDVSRVIVGIQMLKNFEGKSHKILRLWAHEIARVFGDRLVYE